MPPSSRMLTLLSLLQSRRDWPGPLLAERLEISDRTVRRDVDRLRELGYRIHATKGPDGGYRLDAGSELPPLLFDDEQAVVLAVALQSVSVAGTGLGDAADRALATVRQIMPSRLRHRIDALQITAVTTHDSPGVDTALLESLGGAVRGQQIVRFDYATPDRLSDTDPIPRRAEPHGLVVRSGRWFLVAWDLDREAWRTFRVDRIGLRSHLGPGFTPREIPGGDLGTFVSARFTGAEGSDGWACRGEILIDRHISDVAPYIVDGTAIDLGGGRTRVSLGAWSWRALAARLGQLDGDIEVIGPPELAQAFAALAVRFAAAAGASGARAHPGVDEPDHRSVS